MTADVYVLRKKISCAVVDESTAVIWAVEEGIELFSDLLLPATLPQDDLLVVSDDSESLVEDLLAMPTHHEGFERFESRANIHHFFLADIISGDIGVLTLVLDSGGLGCALISIANARGLR